MSDPNFTVAGQPLGGTRHAIEVAGEIDLYSAPELGAAIGRAFQEGANELLVDLSGTSFVDSAGLAVLVTCARRARELGGRLVIVSGVDAVMRTIEVTGLDQLLAVFSERDAALVALADRD